MRGPVQPGDHPAGAGFVQDQPEVPGERQQRDQGSRSADMKRRVPIACAPMRAARSRPPARRPDVKVIGPRNQQLV